MELQDAKPLFSIGRGNFQEVVINGYSVFKREKKAPMGDGARQAVFVRSLLKPWQFMVANAFGTESYWAIGLASHSGEAKHLKALNDLAKLNSVSMVDLRCPHAYPASVYASAKLLVDNRPKERVFNACSGKHLVWLAACRTQGFNNDYLNLEHPLQAKVIEFIESKVDKKLTWAVDGCGLMTPYCLIAEQMDLWEELALSEDARAQGLKKLWTDNPELVGGEGRLDSDLVKVGRGRLVAKEGADGLLMVQSLGSFGEPVQGCYVKINSGYHPPYMGLALWRELVAKRNELNQTFKDVLDFLDTKKEEWIPHDQRILVSNEIA